MSKRFFVLLTLSIAVFPFVSLFAQSPFTSVASGPWNADATWSGAGIPVAGSVATIANGHTVTVTANAACTTLNINDGGALSVGGFNLTVSGTTTVGGGASGSLTISSAAGTKIFTGLVTIAAGATWTNTAANSPVTFRGGITNNGTFNAGTGVHTFDTNPQALTGTLTIPSVTVTGVTLTNNNTLTVGTALSGTGGLTQAVNSTLNIGGTSGITTLTATAAGNTVNYTGAAQTVKSTNFFNLGLSGSGAKTLQAGTTAIGGNLTLSGTVTTTTVVGLGITGNLNIGNGTAFTAAGFALTVSGTTTVGGGASGSLTISSAAGTKIFTGLVTIAVGATWTNTAANSPVTFRGGITNNGTFNAGTGVHTFDTNPQALTGTLTIPSVTVTGVTLTNNNTLTVATALSGTGGLTQAVNSTLNIGGTSGITTLTATAAGNTVNYTGAAQTVNSTNYINLGLSGSGAKTLQGGTTTIGGNLTLSGTVTTTTVVGLGITGNLNIGNGTAFTAAGFALTVSGTTTVGGGASGSLTISSAAGTKIFTGLVTIAVGATWTNTAANSPVTFRGGITNNGTFNAGTGVHTFDTNPQALTGTLTIPSVTVTGVTLTNNNTLTVGTALSGTGGLTQAANSTLNIGGTSGITTLTATAAGNTVNYTGAAQTVNSTNFFNLGLSGSGAKTLQGGTTAIGGNLTLSGTVTTTTVVGLGITGNLNIGDGTAFTAAGFALTVSGTTTVGGGASGSLTISSAAGTKIFTGLVTIAVGATWTNTAANSPVTFRGGITNNGTFNAGTGVHTFDTNPQALTGTLTIPSVTVTGVTLTNNNTLTVATALSGTGGLTQAANSTLNIGGTSGITTLTATAAGNTVNYTGAAQTVKSTNYFNLGLSGSGAKTLQGGTTAIGGNLTLSGTVTTTTVVGLGITGNLNIGDGTAFTAAGFALTVSGTTTVGGGASGSLTISSAAGTKIFTGLVTIAVGATWTNTAANSPVTFRGGITNNGTFNAGTGVHTFDTNPQALTGTLTIPSVTVTGVTLTNNNTLTVGTALSGTGGLTQAANSTLNIGGTSGITTLTATAGGNTVNYTGAGQTVKSSASNIYINLGLSGSGNKTFSVATTISGDLSISGPAVANLGAGLTHTANTLTLGAAGQVSGSHGSTGSLATTKNDTYFLNTSNGIVNVCVTTSGTPTTYYSRNTTLGGNWNDNNSWTTSADGSGGPLAVGEWPKRFDNVVIRAGHTVTVDAIDDNKSCGASPDGLLRTNVGPFTSSNTTMFYQTGDLLIDGTLSVTTGVNLMIENYTHITSTGSLSLVSNLVNLGYLEADASATLTSANDIVLAGFSSTIINNAATATGDLIISFLDAILCGTGSITLTGGVASTIVYENPTTAATHANQICTTFTVNCSGVGCAGFPVTGVGSLLLGNTGPGGVGNGTNNKLWLRANDLSLANGAAVDSWSDVSGNALTATNGTAGERPTFATNSANGFPSLTFDGTNDNLSLGAPAALNFVPLTDSWSFIIAYRAPANGFSSTPNQGTLFSKAWTTNRNYQYQIDDISVTNSAFTSYIGNLLNSGTVTINTNAWVVSSHTNTTAAKSSFSNEASNFSGAAIAAGADATTEVLIGARRDTGPANGTEGFLYTGDIAEIMMYNRVVNTAQRIIISDYLAAKYAVALSANDFYTMDDVGNGNFDYEVAGIGQASDGSNHRDALGSGIVRMWNPSNLGNGEFLIWGHDNTALYSSTTSGVGAPIQERLSRTWRVSESGGDVGTVAVSFDISLLATPLGSNLRLLIDRDNDGFADNDVTPIAGTFVDNTVVFSGVNFQDDDKFTLGNTDVSRPLPIELISFSAKLNNDIVELKWSTASELNNDFFTIERASNIEEFEAIGNPIDGKGTTAEKNYYVAIDENPLYGRSYYRLKQTDFDGKFTYSDLQVIDYEGPRFSTLKVYPNPSQGHTLTIEVNGLKDQSTVPVQIYNVQGQKVYEHVFEVNTPGMLKHDFDFGSTLKQGLYIIKAGQTLELSQKIIIN